MTARAKRVNGSLFSFWFMSPCLPYSHRGGGKHITLTVALTRLPHIGCYVRRNQTHFGGSHFPALQTQQSQTRTSSSSSSPQRMFRSRFAFCIIIFFCVPTSFGKSCFHKQVAGSEGEKRLFLSRRVRVRSRGGKLDLNPERKRQRTPSPVLIFRHYNARAYTLSVWLINWVPFFLGLLATFPPWMRSFWVSLKLALNSDLGFRSLCFFSRSRVVLIFAFMSSALPLQSRMSPPGTC